MDVLEKRLFDRIKENGDEKERALAAFMFRDVIEGYLSKYNISEEDKFSMYKEALARAYAYFKIENDPEAFERFCELSTHAAMWDAPDDDTVETVIDKIKTPV